MNIEINRGENILYGSSKCAFCGRQLPEDGTCKCGVWRRVKIKEPVYLIETTEEAESLVRKKGYWLEQREQELAGN